MVKGATTFCLHHSDQLYLHRKEYVVNTYHIHTWNLLMIMSIYINSPYEYIITLVVAVSQVFIDVLSMYSVKNTVEYLHHFNLGVEVGVTSCIPHIFRWGYPTSIGRFCRRRPSSVVVVKPPFVKPPFDQSDFSMC